jgi:hypothetical protein
MRAVIPTAALRAQDLSDGAKLVTVVGEDITVDKSDDTVAFQPAAENAPVATVVTADVCAGKSYVHVIDEVLLPQAASPAIQNGNGAGETGPQGEGIARSTEFVNPSDDAVASALYATARVTPGSIVIPLDRARNEALVFVPGHAMVHGRIA